MFSPRRDLPFRTKVSARERLAQLNAYEEALAAYREAAAAAAKPNASVTDKQRAQAAQATFDAVNRRFWDSYWN